MQFTRITTDPGRMGGVPCIRGLRIPVATVVEMVADGMGDGEILAAYPDLEREDIVEALRCGGRVREGDTSTSVLLEFLIANALSPVVAGQLRKAGYETVHVRDRGMRAATDEELFELAKNEGFVLVSADTDFGTLLALRNSPKPSVIIFRRTSGRRPEAQSELLLRCLPEIREALQQGSAIVIEETRLRIRTLPIRR